MSADGGQFVENAGQGGWVLNASGLSGSGSVLEYGVSFPNADTLPTTITSGAPLNIISAGIGQETVSVPTATTAGTGNEFIFAAVDPGYYSPYGPLGAGAGAGQTPLASVTAPSEIIAAGFTSGGNNPAGSTGQLLLGTSYGGLIPGTAANFVVSPVSFTEVAGFAAFVTAAAAALTNTVDYYFGVVGTNGYLAVDNMGPAHTISEIIELTGVTSMSFHDIII